MKKIIHDVIENTISEIDLTKLEIDLIKSQFLELEEKTEPLNKLIAEKNFYRESALAKLAALGLTPEEIAAL